MNLNGDDSIPTRREVSRRKRRAPRVKFGGPNPFHVYWGSWVAVGVGIVMGSEALMWGSLAAGIGYLAGVFVTSATASVEYVEP